jgi:peptide/nickel transport system substrate-binding protein
MQKSRLLPILGAVLLATTIACAQGARAPEAPPTQPSAPTATPAAAAKPTAPAAGVTAVPATSGAQPTGAQPTGGELVVGKEQEAPGLDPAKNPAAAAILVFDLMYSRLVRLDDQMRPTPDLAERWEQTDPKTFVFHLRRGVKFHSGRELTSADVKYTYERILNPETASIARSFFDVIDKIDAPDPATVVFTLKQPFAPFLVNTAITWAGIVDRDVVQANNGDLNKVDAGSGPFKLEEWTPQTRTVLVKNPDYYVPGQPAIDKLTFLIMPEESARIAALRTGNVQFTELTSAGFDTLKNDRSVAAINAPTLSYTYLGMNVAKPPLDKPQVRQAISYAVDRNEIVQTVFRGYARLTGPIPTAMADWALDPAKFPAYKPDLDKAKQLMAEAGLPNGFKTTIMAMATLDYQVEAAQVIQSQLQRINIQSDVQPLEVGVYVDTWKKKGMELMVGGNGAGTNPDRAICFFFCTDGSANVWNFSDPQVDQLALQASQSSDPAMAKQLYDQAQLRIVDGAPNLFLANQDQFLAYSPKVKNFKPMPDGSWQGLIQTSIER